jgi:outer membrane protein OmpA-like peptidoglycan-associated protein
MKQFLLTGIIITLLLPQLIMGQNQHYTITKALFSSDENDEFSPVFYRNGVVFCTTRNKSPFVNYSGTDNKGQLKIFFIDTTKNQKWQHAGLLSKSLWSKVNDGPASFNKTFDTIYFSRNLIADGSYKDVTGMRNKLGIFTAVYNGRKWDKMQEFRYNSEWYNITTPCISSDGSKLYFASDRPDGYGGSDIYYCQWKNGIWGEPVNLGPQINTKGNESYPFINEEGELFFSSDGHPGLGGKDIFVTKPSSSGWYTPVGLEAPINSGSDDFGIVTDPLVNEGYFSSNREKTRDIYHFKSNLFHFWFSVPQKENQYCYNISDTGIITVDTLRLNHEWDFGDKSKKEGTNVRYCFPGPGKYRINLDLTDKRTGNLFFRKLTYNIDIIEIEQPFITSPDIAFTGENIEFNGLKSYCPGYTITGYFWDFGDGTYGIGEKADHKYVTNGEPDVKLGLTLKSEKTGDIISRVVSKRLRVVPPEQKNSLSEIRVTKVIQGLNDIKEIDNIIVNGQYSAEIDNRKESVFQLVILTSPGKISLNSASFRKVPADYSVKEFFDPETGLYSYIVDQQKTLMATYPAYSEIVAAGFKDAHVRIYVLKDPAEKDLYNIRKNFDLLTDNYFDAGNRLTTSAYIMLDQVVNLLNKYPDIKLEIGIHTDNQGIQTNNIWFSLARAQIIADYLINRGINGKRLTTKGYGGTRPVASNINPTERKLNRRVDFTIQN